MGFLEIGKPLSYKETKRRTEHVRMLGILELLCGYLRNLNRKDEVHKFGHEIEYLLVHLDPDSKKAKLVPCGLNLIDHLNNGGPSNSFKFMPEFASYMIEGVPKNPWELYSDFAPHILPWFSEAYDIIKTGLDELGLENVHPLTITSFPLLGVPDTIYHYESGYPEQSMIMESDYCDDVLVSPHPRFGTLARNIRLRRGKKVYISPPVLCNADHVSTNVSQKSETSSLTNGDVSFQDNVVSENKETTITKQHFDYIAEAAKVLPENTISSPNNFLDGKLSKLIDDVVASSVVRELDLVTPSIKIPGPDVIHMDAMVFGMGMGCVQTTYSCLDESEARYLYDQFTVLSPLFLAMTAATPIYRGFLSRLTTRWRVLSESVDDRRDEELSHIPFSRYSTVSLFISREPFLRDRYAVLNDVRVPSRPDIYDVCLSAGLDCIIARHYAAIFSRDPIVLFEEDLTQVDVRKTDHHFENFQSTNWNTVRFKPPPVSEQFPTMPWRVEFRCCESQLRPEENASLVILMATVVRVILKERWNLYIPMSLVHDNMEASDSQDAVTKQKFHFKTNLGSETLETKKYTLHEIFFSNDDLGLFRRCAKYYENELKAGAISKESYDIYMNSLSLFEKRMLGMISTNAQEIRDSVLNHPEYKGDGKVNHGIVYDLLIPFV